MLFVFDIASPPATYRAKVKLFLKKVDGRYISVSDELIKNSVELESITIDCHMLKGVAQRNLSVRKVLKDI